MNDNNARFLRHMRQSDQSQIEFGHRTSGIRWHQAYEDPESGDGFQDIHRHFFSLASFPAVRLWKNCIP